MKIELQPNESLIKQAGANLLRGRETVGGRLFLTNNRLYFDTHAVNFATGPSTIQLSDIADIEPVWTRFLGFIPIFPNSMRVLTKGGNSFDFVVRKRHEWKSEIERQVRLHA